MEEINVNKNFDSFISEIVIYATSALSSCFFMGTVIERAVAECGNLS
jgi:hypothetical protein